MTPKLSGSLGAGCRGSRSSTVASWRRCFWVTPAPSALQSAINGHVLGVDVRLVTVALTALISVLPAKSAPGYARDIVYGVVILAILLFYGRQAEETA